MADYIYLLENRLSPAQRSALRVLREVARSKALTIFLVGGAVRDLTSGSPVRDLDVVVQGNALKLKKDIEKVGGVVTGEYDAGQSLFVNFPGNARVEVGSTLSITFPKPGKAVYRPATILEDLRRRDFTANAMALSLNDGSYGLLMDPLNGVADIENRQLRLVSNYGFIEDPVRMIRAARLSARLGWTMDEKTQARYDTGKQEDYIGSMAEFHRGYETEEIVHEEDPLRVLKRLEAEGWMKVLAPYWTLAKVNVPDLQRLREAQTQLQMQGIHPDTSAAHFPLLTAKLSAKEVQTLKESFPRQGFVVEIDRLEADAKDFANQLTSKAAALPSQAWKLITTASPEAVLWVSFSTKSSALQAKFKNFLTEWPLARQKMPYVMMQEMRIVPELPEYDTLLEKLFFELMDGKLQTPEEMKAFLEPYSPPAPPPPINMRRPRAAKKEAKAAKPRAKKSVKTELDAEEAISAEETMSIPAPIMPDTPNKVAPTLPKSKKKALKPAAETPVASETPVKTATVKKVPTSVKAVPVKAIPAKKTVAIKKATAKPMKLVASAKVSSKSTPAKGKVLAQAKNNKPAVKNSAKSAAKKISVAKSIGKSASLSRGLALKGTPKKSAKTVVKKHSAKVVTEAGKAPAKKIAVTKQVAKGKKVIAKNRKR